MNKNSDLPCPQCLHQNSLTAIKCSLCDWPLNTDISDETRMPEDLQEKVDPDMTTAPYLGTASGVDPDQTQAPISENINPTKSIHSVSEKQTFYLAGNLAHFEIHKILGQGGMGAVYHAKDRTLHRDVAIKMLRPLAASSKLNTEALLEEARMASKLNHPNIVTIYDVARSEGSNYIVMEWVDGQPLDEIIPPDGLELEVALEYACQIADGLKNAHQKYIIHRDIKPHNIMLSADGSIKILDFGIAGYINQSPDDFENIDLNSDTELTSSGTPSYMSPEQAQGLNLDQRSDIFSFGIVLYQMLSGKRPFIGKNFTELKKEICSGSYSPILQQLPELPLNVAHLLDKMLSTAKDERWQSSTELAEALHGIYNHLTHKKNWWQRRNWMSKAAIILPFILTIGWSSKEILFPASTQQLIERQLKESNKIAILPFENISGDPQIQLFGDGLAVNLGSDLSAIASYQGKTWIVPSTEISRMKDQSIKNVTDKYGVNLILTGSIQHMGSTRLLVLNLINAGTEQQLKTTEVSIDADNLFQGHSKIRSQALTLLNWTIPDDLSNKFQTNRPKLDGAYKEYVQSMGYLYRYDQKGNIEKALESLQNAKTIDSSYEDAYESLFEVYLLRFLQTNDISWLNKMTTTINQLKTINPNNKEINYLSAIVAMQKGEYQRAVELYQSSANQNPKHIKSKIGLANALSKMGNIEKANSFYQSAISQAPNNWNVVSEYGIFNFQNGKYQESLNQFKKMTEMSPNNHYGYSLMAAAYYSMNDIEYAIIYSRKSLDIRPSDVSYTNLGTMLFSIKKYKESLVPFKKAIELKDSEYINWGNLADAYKLTNDSRSIESYNNAAIRARNLLKTNPNNATVKSDLAYYLANLNNKQEAILYAKQIGTLNTGSENFIVALAYDQLEMIDEVIKHLKIALDKNYPMEEIISTPLIKFSKENNQFKKLSTDN